MRFTLSLLNALSQRSQNNTTPQDARELAQDELAQLYGGWGTNCHHHKHHHNHNNNCDYYCHNYYGYSYCCYTY